MKFVDWTKFFGVFKNEAYHSMDLLFFMTIFIVEYLFFFPPQIFGEGVI